MKTYFSIRVVHANNKNQAVKKVIDANFDESHPLCDDILTDKQLTKYLKQVEKIEFGFVEYKGVRYKTREIEQDGEIITVCEYDLNELLVNSKGGYRNKEARYLDTQIAYYANKHEMMLPDNELIKIIYK